MAGMATGMATGVLPGVRPGMAAAMATMVRGRADLRPRRTTGACGAFIEPSGHPAVAGNPAVADNYAVAQLCKWNPAVALAASEVQKSVAMPMKRCLDEAIQSRSCGGNAFSEALERGVGRASAHW